MRLRLRIASLTAVTVIVSAVLSLAACRSCDPVTGAPGLSPGVRIVHEYGNVHKRAVFDKSPNGPSSPARRVVIEATYPL
jgi:hypothetical protein